ncbi:MAG TPA: ATP-binding protein [Chitinophagaceae bacterium]|nr:ATP-binding protein [Chitinophagaceae bacterium]
MKTNKKISLSRLSIQQRLPLLIFVLLFSIIVIFSWISYLGVKNASFAVARERLSTLTSQLSNMFQQNVEALTNSARLKASDDSVENFLLTGDKQFQAHAQDVLDKSRNDTLVVDAELLNARKVPILSSTKKNVQLNVNIDSVLPPPATAAGFAGVGKIFTVDKFMYYPVVATVTSNNKVAGYVIFWRLLLATPKAIKQLAQIIGANGTLYFGNDDGKFWTDMLKPVSSPPVDMSNLKKIIEYSREQDDPLFATASLVPNSRWVILLEFSKKTFLEASLIFLRWIIVISILFIAAGSFIAWRMSRNITRPLKKLTAAATGIASGNYGSLVDIDRQDELGQLAEAFNIMVIQVRNAQKDLEKKVQDRTFELENTNKELEAFSYSVSHDLHAPLRIIDSYASILSEKSAGKLDEEGNKILTHIRHKTKRMGTLIDELLNLSYLGRKEPDMEVVDMDITVRAVIKEQLMLYKYTADINIGNLLPTVCDSILIRQVWSNLISNALKYSSKKEKACIEIDSYARNNEIVYSVKDNGVGFDMKYSDKLFGVFQRLHGQKEFEGSGVGLALVQRVILKHGGKVWAEAEEGKGAAFYFTLPCRG